MFKKFINFYKTSSPIAPLQVSEEEKTKLYKKLRFQAFLAGTIGYSLSTCAVPA
jgi:OPA family sugar phosphate sensor protein UhpC-like MFS transporter